MTIRSRVLVGAAMVLSGCAASGMQAAPTPIYPPSVYDQRVSTNEVSIYWRCVQQADTVQFEGVVQNTKGGRVKFMELEIAGADAGGKYVASATTALADIILQPSQISPFALQVRSASGGLRLDLFYRYEVDSAIGGDTRPHFRALDVCSPTQHRFRK
jgi:hypothetical protein